MDFYENYGTRAEMKYRYQRLLEKAVSEALSDHEKRELQFLFSANSSNTETMKKYNMEHE